MNTQLVHLSNNRLVTTSLLIAQNFGKKHAHVLRDVENLECSQEFRESNFGLSSYLTSQNKEMPMYEITRDGFVFLCMGFTGAAAAQWKERYINAFNQMANHIVANHTQLEALKAAYLQDNPDAEKLLRYREMGLTYTEISKLLNMAESTIGRRLFKYAELGLCEYTPNPKMSALAQKAHAKMQQSLDLEA